MLGNFALCHAESYILIRVVVVGGLVPHALQVLSDICMSFILDLYTRMQAPFEHETVGPHM